MNEMLHVIDAISKPEAFICPMHSQHLLLILTHTSRTTVIHQLKAGYECLKVAIFASMASMGSNPP